MLHEAHLTLWVVPLNVKVLAAIARSDRAGEKVRLVDELAEHHGDPLFITVLLYSVERGLCPVFLS